MNFQLLPPAITSLQMYTGAGSVPMLAAAASWEGLCGELGSAAESFSSLTSGLPWQQVLSAAKSPGGLAGVISQIQANNQAQIGNLSSMNSRQISAAVDVTKTNLAAAGAAALKGDVVTAGKDVVDAGLVDAGTAVRLGGINALAPLNIAGQDLDIAGGGAGLLQMTPTAPSAQVAPLLSGGTGTTLQQLLQYDQARVQSVANLNSAQVAATQQLAQADLASALKAGSAGNFVAAATYGEDAALINAGTGMQVTARSLQLVPGLIGIDLQALGGAGPIKSTF